MENGLLNNTTNFQIDPISRYDIINVFIPTKRVNHECNYIITDTGHTTGTTNLKLSQVVRFFLTEPLYIFRQRRSKDKAKDTENMKIT